MIVQSQKLVHSMGKRNSQWMCGWALEQAANGSSALNLATRCPLEQIQQQVWGDDEGDYL